MREVVTQFRGTVYENGYGQVAQKVMRDKGLSPTAKLIYAYLVSFAGQDGIAYPSVDRMIDELGIKEDTLYKYRKELVGSGYVSIEKQRRVNGKFCNTVYVIEAVRERSADKEEDSPHPISSGTVDSGVEPYPISSGTVKSGTTSNRSLKVSRSLDNKQNSKQASCPSEVTQGDIGTPTDLSERIKTVADAVSNLAGFRPGENQIRRWLERYDEQRILKNVSFIGDHRGRLDNPAGALEISIREDWATQNQQSKGGTANGKRRYSGAHQTDTGKTIGNDIPKVTAGSF